jgi:hypothetical protein
MIEMGRHHDVNLVNACELAYFGAGLKFRMKIVNLTIIDFRIFNSLCLIMLAQFSTTLVGHDTTQNNEWDHTLFPRPESTTATSP